MLIISFILAFVGTTAPASLQSQASADSLRWQTLPDALEQAATTGQPILLYVYAPWCGPCRQMERDVFPQTTALLNRVSLVRLDFDDHESRVYAKNQMLSPFDWARHYGAESTPTFIFVDAAGTVITRATGSLDTKSFSLLLAYIATGAYRHATFSEYVAQASS